MCPICGLSQGEEGQKPQAKRSCAGGKGGKKGKGALAILGSSKNPISKNFAQDYGDFKELQQM